MESGRIAELLEKYFEGDTSLQEEKLLGDYFAGENVAPELEAYKPIFAGFITARQERATKEIRLPKKRFAINNKFAAAVAAVFVGVGIFFFSQPRLSSDEKEALEAFEKSRESMMFLSEKFNLGAQQLNYIDEFTESKNKVFESEKIEENINQE